MRVHVVDPAAYTPPYDHALCAALAAAGADVTLRTTKFPHGDVPIARNYRVDEVFYRGANAFGPRLRAPLRAARHVPDMLRERIVANRHADIEHFQWLAVQPVDVRLLPSRPPVVLTAHDVLPREPRPGQLDAQKRLYEKVDAVVVHSQHGKARLLDELQIDPAKVTVIPHGVLDHLVSVPATRPPEITEPDYARPVVLFFGLIRPYKGLDLLSQAWTQLQPDAELWVVGAPRSAPPELPAGTSKVLRYVSDAEAAWCFAHADAVVLPYREIDQSGVLFTALAFARPLILTDVGGFPETGDAALHVPAGDVDALSAAIDTVVRDVDTRVRLSQAARRAAGTTYAWGPIAAQHLELYGTLTDR